MEQEKIKRTLGKDERRRMEKYIERRTGGSIEKILANNKERMSLGATNRLVTRILQESYDLKANRDKLEKLIWFYAKFDSDDKQPGDVPSWFFDAFLGLVEVFSVSQPGDHRRHNADKFTGEYRHFQPNELKEVLEKSAAQTLSAEQITAFTDQIKICQIATFRPSKSGDMLYVRFNVGVMLLMLRTNSCLRLKRDVDIVDTDSRISMAHLQKHYSSLFSDD